MLCTQQINMFVGTRSGPRVAYDSDLVVSAHETLENFDLSLATEDKAFVNARQYTDKSRVYLIIALFNMVKRIKCFRSLRAGEGGLFFLLLWNLKASIEVMV